MWCHVVTLLLLLYVGAATVELVAVSQIKPFIQSHWNLETTDLGLMSTATFFGEIIGGIVWAHYSDAYGREPVFLATSLLMVVFSVALLFCSNFTLFCCVRLLLGFAIGGGLSVDFVYFIECVPPRNRSFRSAFIILIGIIGGKIHLKRYKGTLIDIQYHQPLLLLFILLFSSLFCRVRVAVT